MNPMTLAQEMETARTVPRGSGERFSGYGIPGLPFSSGHILAFRRMTASSVGPPYTTLWHRGPTGAWTFFTDVEPGLSCLRYFGRAVREVVTGEIELSWEGSFDLSLRVPEAGIQWGLRLSGDAWTMGMGAMGRILPAGIWKSPRALGVLGGLGGWALGLGEVALRGRTPEGHLFTVAPRRLWRVEATAAILGCEDLGSMGPLREQASLGDFLIPNEGIFAAGEYGFSGSGPGSLLAGLGGTGAGGWEEGGMRSDEVTDVDEQERRQVS